MAIYEATNVRTMIDGVDVTGAFPLMTKQPDASKWSVTSGTWTPVPGSVLDDLLAPLDPEPPRARNFDGRLAWLTRKHAAERRVIRDWLRRGWDGSWQRGAPLPLP